MPGEFNYSTMTILKNEGAEHHKEAATWFELAAKHHIEAAKYHEEGNYEEAAHHAIAARGNQLKGEQASDRAAEYHSKDHGNKR